MVVDIMLAWMSECCLDVAITELPFKYIRTRPPLLLFVACLLDVQRFEVEFGIMAMTLFVEVGKVELVKTAKDF
eukprot:scaffold8087_cov141-Skeletonema_marinoi.AAC.4